MQTATNRSEASNANFVITSSQPSAFEVWCVGDIDTRELPTAFTLKDGRGVSTRQLQLHQLPAALRTLADPKRLVVVYLPLDSSHSFIVSATLLRADLRYRQTRVYLVPRSRFALESDSVAEEDFDVEHTLQTEHLNRSQWLQAIERGVGTFAAIGDDPTNGYYFLDTKYNDVFSWFERTRWDISEVPDLAGIQRELLTPDYIKLIKHAAIAEFGTLPGAHNFLREWADDISFSNWSLAWGAEEARHSLILCRYLKAVGIDVMSKHALYKRKPYDPGATRASTLMMNVISEARAASIYARTSEMTEEPVAKKIFALMSRDEARHASAFAQFCKEQCDLGEDKRISAMEQAYFWLAQQRRGGFRHPAGEFYPHTQTAEGFSEAEAHVGRDGTDSADASVLRMIRKIVRDDSIQSARDIKRWLRDRSTLPSIARITKPANGAV